MYFYLNISMWLDGFIILSTSYCYLVFFRVFLKTDNQCTFISGWFSLLPYSFWYCPIISIKCAWRSDHVISLFGHDYTSPYGSRSQGTKLKFSCFSFTVNLSELKIYINFMGTPNVPKSLCRNLAPLYPSAAYLGFLDVSILELAPSPMYVTL